MSTLLYQPRFPWRLRIAVLGSLLAHALLLSLSLGGDAFGLPGLRFPWEERRLAAHDLHVVLEAAAPAPAPVPAEQPAPLVEPGIAVRPAPLPRPVPEPLAAESIKPDVEIGQEDSKPVPAQATLARETQDAQQRQAELIALAQREAARQEELRQEAFRVAQAARDEAARMEAGRLDAARQEQERLDAARKEQATQAQVEAERQEMLRQEQLKLAQREAARQEQAKQELARQELAKQELAKQELAKQEQARQELAKQEQAKQEQARQEQARQEQARQEQARQEQARQEQARQEQARQEQAKQEQARQELAKQEQARQEQARQEQARKDQAGLEKAEQEAKREERLRAIGRQLDQEAAQRTVSGLRRGWMFGRADPNAELVQYAQAMGRKIELNMSFDMVRELVRQPHVRPVVTVAVRADGSVEKVSFVSSSGVAALDEAVRKIIASQAPYGAFPPALARQYDVIEIRRTWVFDMAVRLE
ncbi:TonB C-terminal domain-containing protein [Massilia sp. LjRoot122]|uniref:TonB C-terminal domain-containing protein n=1 Tax=Massilia sp. LjRoot122 TaxID=3342257 RepID=UPI003ED15A6B